MNWSLIFLRFLIYLHFDINSINTKNFAFLTSFSSLLGHNSKNNWKVLLDNKFDVKIAHFYAIYICAHQDCILYILIIGL